jgi:tetratricopeptide (TPR) repeat protein
MSSKQRDRGRILTPDGLSRLQQAIRVWELEHEVRCTQERMKELTSAVKEGGLDPSTIRKILKAKDGVDPESIRCLFTTFGLQLDEADLVSSSRLQIQADPNFVGRDRAIGDLNTLVSRGAKVIVIQARGGVGKTTLARKYLQQEFGSYLEFPIAKETKDIASIESLIEEKLRQLGEEPGREFFVSLDRLKRKLQDEPIGILIDNLEPALDSAGKFIEPHRRYVELLRILADPVVRSLTVITSRERLHEASVKVQHYPLSSLDVAAWKRFFQLQQLSTDTPALANLHHAYGGNAKAMEIVCSAIQTDYNNDIEAYWQTNRDDLLIEQDLEDLVTQQFDRLQQIDLDAYNLLCRMGGYRYQDVPTVPIEGLLCLLWDVSENRQRRVIRALQERSLVEVENGEYWLHPVIRSEAIGRLRRGKDWEIANRRVAIFWTERIKTAETIKEALKAFEAYYHYLQIDDKESAGEVIVTRREVRETRGTLCLGDSFYRLSLTQQIITAINQVIDSINSRFSLAEISSILGDAYWVIGDTKRGLEYQEKVDTIVTQLLSESTLKKRDLWRAESIRIYSFITRGFYKIDLWELEEAKSLFLKVIGYSTLPGFERPVKKASFCLAFIYSSLGLKQEAHDLAEQLYDEFFATENTELSSFYLCFLALTYKNLKHPEKALEIYNLIVAELEFSHYKHSRARALNGLAEIHREQRNFKKSLQINLEAIEILNEIGAKYDLSHSYYQLGLTYQIMGEDEESKKNFQNAIQLFTEMEAPKQVERVRRSMLTEPNH